MAWIERTLRAASLRDVGRLLESFLNDELPHLGQPHALQPHERFHSYQSRSICTLFGPVTLRRAYVRGPRGGRFPLDEKIGLHEQYTPAVIQLMCWAGAMDRSYEIASQTLERFAGLSIPGRQAQRVINALGPLASDWMHTRSMPSHPQPVDVLNIQTDMTGIPVRPEALLDISGKQPDGSAKTRQIKLGCVFTQSRDSQGEPQRDPASSTDLAAFCDRTDFGHRLWQEALRRGYATARKTVFIGDGAEWIWNLVNDRFSGTVQIVDFYHACEHLHALCLAMEPDPATAESLFQSWRKRLKNNGLAGILANTAKRLHALSPAARSLVEEQVPYFEKNAHRMRYRTFRHAGFFIGSGAIEGACRHIVAQRTKLSGMRWLCTGAENTLTFRCLIKSNLFDAYCSAPPRAA